MNSLLETLMPFIDQEHMSSDQINVFKGFLLEERIKITNQLYVGETQLKSSEGKHSDVADVASQFEELSLTLIGRDALTKRLNEVSKALNRLTHDEYGFCEACGVNINIKRLVANPTAKCCIDCQTIVDGKSHAYARSV